MGRFVLLRLSMRGIQPWISTCFILRATMLLTYFTDGFHPISPRRLHDVIVSTQSPSSPSPTPPSIEGQTDNFLHFRAPTLAHLIGLLCKPTSNAIPDNTSLIVIDTLSSLLNHAYPRSFETRRSQKGNIAQTLHNLPITIC